MTGSEAIEKYRWSITATRVANALFLLMCGDEDYKLDYEFYEAIEMDGGETKTESAVRANERDALRTVRDGVQPLFCAQVETEIY